MRSLQPFQKQLLGLRTRLLEPDGQVGHSYRGSDTKQVDLAEVTRAYSRVVGFDAGEPSQLPAP